MIATGLGAFDPAASNYSSEINLEDLGKPVLCCTK